MSSLAVLSTPAPRGRVTVCEYSAQYLTEDATGNEQRGSRLQFCELSDYPVITPGSESVQSPHNMALPLSKPAFKEGLVSKLLDLWYAEGTRSVLETCQSECRDEVPGWLDVLTRCGLKVYKVIDTIYSRLFPHMMMSREEVMATFSSVADWEKSPYRCFAWHPHTSKFAVGSKDDSVRVHTFGSSTTPVLKHKQQKGITCLAWRPLSASDLAVGCCNGIFIWHLDPNSTALRPRSTSVRQLMHPGHCPVTSISWSPGGFLLASGSPLDSAMLIWDVSTGTATALSRVGGGSSLLRWSPDETKLFSATPTALFRVWETKTWTLEKWSNFAKKCQSSCWSPDGRILLFVIEGDPAIFSLKFEHYDEHSRERIGGAKMAVKVADLSEHTWETGDEVITIGGSVHSMAWDPQGERLAVILKDEEGKTQEFVVVFRTKLSPSFEIMACGTVRGGDGDTPQMISFQENFDRGAMLTVCWCSGAISFIPLLFTPVARLTGDLVSPGRVVSTRNGSLYSDSPAAFPS